MGVVYLFGFNIVGEPQKRLKSRLDGVEIKTILNSLKIIRNKKLFHIDPKNAMGHTVIDSLTNAPVAVTLEQIEILVVSATEIVTAHECLFNKSVCNYVTMSSGSAEVLGELEHICFK